VPPSPSSDNSNFPPSISISAFSRPSTTTPRSDQTRDKVRWRILRLQITVSFSNQAKHKVQSKIYILLSSIC
jgi:hypothetical protein